MIESGCRLGGSYSEVLQGAPLGSKSGSRGELVFYVFILRCVKEIRHTGMQAFFREGSRVWRIYRRGRIRERVWGDFSQGFFFDEIVIVLKGAIE